MDLWKVENIAKKWHRGRTWRQMCIALTPSKQLEKQEEDRYSCDKGYVLHHVLDCGPGGGQEQSVFDTPIQLGLD